MRRTTGFVAPNIQFYDELTVQENMDFVQKMSGLAPSSRTHNESESTDWLAKTQIKNLAEYRLNVVHRQQRVKLAIALSVS